MKDSNRAKKLLDGESCNNCEHSLMCNTKQKARLVCGRYRLSMPSQVFKVVRMSYPTSIRADLFCEFAMEKTDTVYRLNKGVNNDIRSVEE